MHLSNLYLSFALSLSLSLSFSVYLSFLSLSLFVLSLGCFALFVICFSFSLPHCLPAFLPLPRVSVISLDSCVSLLPMCLSWPVRIHL